MSAFNIRSRIEFKVENDKAIISRGNIAFPH